MGDQSQTYRNFNSLTQRRIETVSRQERQRFNLMERAVDYRAQLRDNNMIYEESTPNEHTKLWVTKPRTAALEKRLKSTMGSLWH